MGQHTDISWASHTFNPVWGCFEVGPECDNCYARTFAKRVGHGGHWGADAGFRTFGAAHWAEPLKWDAAAKAAGERRRVFCASMADVGDPRWPYGVHAQLWNLIKATPNLDWMLLTKRIHLLRKLLPKDWGDGYANVWLGVTCGTQAGADVRVPQLLATPARVRFLSCEPLLGPVDLDLPRCDEHDRKLVSADGEHCTECAASGFSGELSYGHWLGDVDRGIDWVIAGGESGGKARPMHPALARTLRDQCAASGVAFHFKQWGEWAPIRDESRGFAEHMFADQLSVFRIGTKNAGRELDGVIHDAFPVVE